MKVIAAVFITGAVLLAALFGYVLYNGPRMKVQPHLRAFQATMPPPPAGTAVVHPAERLPSALQAGRLKNPLAASGENVERGRVYYRYYCLFCHGESGAGNGPVGESYIPVPTDLRSTKVRRYRDGELLRAMLTGKGHEPVLEQVVPPRHRWYLVQYVRSLPGRTR